MGANCKLQLFLTEAPPGKDFSDIKIATKKEFKKFRIRGITSKFCFTIELPPKKSFMIGRIEDICPIYFPPFDSLHLDISSEHCFLYFKDKTVYLRDNDSTNGTRFRTSKNKEWKVLQGKRVALKNHSFFGIGGYIFRVIFPPLAERLTDDEIEVIEAEESNDHEMSISNLNQVNPSDIVTIPNNSKVIRTQDDTHEEREALIISLIQGIENQSIHSLTKKSFVEGKFRLKAVMGEGVCANVFKVKKMVGHKETLAVKISNPIKYFSDKTKERFRWEEKALLNLQHPNIIEYKDLEILEFKEKHYYFQVLEYFNETTLQSYVEEHGPMDWEEVNLITQQLVEALFYMHRKGITHRDLKPSNILYDIKNETVKIIDFSLMKLAEKKAQAFIPYTYTGKKLKESYYMAPEQVMNIHDIDKQGDLYSLGATLYFLLTSQVPYYIECSSQNQLSYLKFITTTLAQSPKPPFWTEQISREIPEEAIDLVNSLLAYLPRERPSSAQEVRNYISENFV